ncbi:hypothetical protein HYV72_01165 [Candidatus Uhrbacteria bacterium]|nr:hypothetical protein [Candidatus Uhrbacteria bacterium]
MDSINHKRRGSKIALGASLGCLGLIVLFVLSASWTVAKTGLVNIPLLSRRMEPPSPTRVVNTNGSLTDIEDAIIKSLKASALSKELTVTLTEEMLTSFFRLSLHADELPDFLVADDAQVAALQNGTLEIFLPIKLDAKKSAVVVTLEPQLNEDGSLGVHVVSLSLGTLRVKRLEALQLDDLFSGMLNDAIDDYASAGRVTAVRVEEGALIMKFTPASTK